MLFAVVRWVVDGEKKGPAGQKLPNKYNLLIEMQFSLQAVRGGLDKAIDLVSLPHAV